MLPVATWLSQMPLRCMVPREHCCLMSYSNRPKTSVNKLFQHHANDGDARMISPAYVRRHFPMEFSKEVPVMWNFAFMRWCCSTLASTMQHSWVKTLHTFCMIGGHPEFEHTCFGAFIVLHIRELLNSTCPHDDTIVKLASLPPWVWAYVFRRMCLCFTFGSSWTALFA